MHKVPDNQLILSSIRHLSLGYLSTFLRDDESGQCERRVWRVSMRFDKARCLHKRLIISFMAHHRLFSAFGSSTFSLALLLPFNPPQIPLDFCHRIVSLGTNTRNGSLLPRVGKECY